MSIPIHEKSGFLQADPYSHDSQMLKLEELEKKDLAYKQRIRYLRLISRILSTIFASYVLGSLAFSLSRYILTKDRIIPESNPPKTAWPNPTVLWPTFLLLALAAFTLFMNFIGLVAYCCGFGAAKKTHKITGKLIHTELLIKLIAWAVAMGLFKMASEDETDLWGYTCGSASDAIQDQVSSFMDFGQLCTVQKGSWYTMIAETVLYALTFITILLGVLRRRHKKIMVQERELANAYESSGAQETGTIIAAGKVELTGKY